MEEWYIYEQFTLQPFPTHPCDQGIITQAVLKGHWVVLEDIDKAPLDFIAGLSLLIERRCLHLPDRCETITAHPQFRLLATRSVKTIAVDPYFIPSLQYFADMWLAVACESPPLTEVAAILESRFPSIPSSVRDRLVRTYVSLNSHALAEGGVRLRAFSLRDLMKSAARIQSRLTLSTGSEYVTEATRILCLAELFDVYIASIREKSLSLVVVRNICLSWEISEDLAISQLVNHCPNLVVGEKAVQIGRVTLDNHRSVISAPTRFGNTHHSLRTMERIAACIAGCEPVLLVGETGGGKTTIVQLLANLAGQRLIVQNLSLATDSSDLIGGYRPVSMTELFHPVYQQFTELFTETFSSSQNADFMHAVTVSFRKQQWKKLLKAFQKAIGFAYTKVSSIAEVDALPLSRRWEDLKAKVVRFDANLER